MVAVQGLEPRTLRIWAACSNHLSYTALRTDLSNAYSVKSQIVCEAYEESGVRSQNSGGTANSAWGRLRKNIVAVGIENGDEDANRNDIEQASDPLEELFFSLFGLYIIHHKFSF